MPTPPLLLKTIGKILWPAEIISLVTTAVGWAMTNSEILMIGMSMLAGVYFLKGYVPPHAEPDETEKRDFFDMLAASIVVKISWIACAVTLIGCLFTVLHLNGGLEQTRVGCLALIGSIVTMGVYAITRDGKKVLPVLCRAVPTCLVGVYLLMNKPV